MWGRLSLTSMLEGLDSPERGKAVIVVHNSPKTRLSFILVVVKKEGMEYLKKAEYRGRNLKVIGDLKQRSW